MESPKSSPLGVPHEVPPKTPPERAARCYSSGHGAALAADAESVGLALG